jgi:CRP/FNR family cyclic AMP-dependent transcriptional regulator
METLHLFEHDPNRKRYAAGEVVFAQGSPRDCMYVVVSGEVEIRIDEVVVETAGVGSMVGEMALIDEGPRSSAVVALSECELVPVDQQRFLFMVQQTPFFAITVMRALSERLRRMDLFLHKMVSEARDAAAG